MKKALFFLSLAFFVLVSVTDTHACTSAIISGKLTPDGRPLLWKHRDTGELNNRVDYIAKSKDVKYAFIAVVNSPREDEGESWMGVNEAGFALINTASSNMHKYDEDGNDQEGKFMYKALATCKTVAEFEAMLKSKKHQPRGVETNFGAIDAQGGAAYFETNSYDYTKYDVNDPTVAPHGFLVYTNFSFTGKPDGGGGYIRYANAQEKIFGRYLRKEGITPQWIFNNLSRSYYNPLLNVDLTKDYSLTPAGWFPDSDFIPRKSTASAAVIKGVKKGENPLLSVMWTILGYPPTAVAVPLFIAAGADQPDFVRPNSETDLNCALCDAALARRAKVFPLQRGSGKNYFYFKAVCNEEGTGYMQRLSPVDANIFETFNSFIERWYSEGAVDLFELKNLYKTVDFGQDIR
ncbi:MAG: hypothetical protein J5699_07940 [Bacteroidales bacterium]|nr:hypothetical protein [Bacteroidales bacterium]